MGITSDGFSNFSFPKICGMLTSPSTEGDNMKKLVVPILAALLLTGCADSGLDSVFTVSVPLPDGRTVLCVIRDTDGLSCDWDNAA